MANERLNAKHLDHMIWIANRASKARGRKDFGFETRLKSELFDSMAPYMVRILRLAKIGLAPPRRHHPRLHGGHE